MGSIFEDFKKGEQKQDTQDLHRTSEKRVFVISRSTEKDEVRIENAVHDIVDSDGYTKSVVVDVVECGVDGVLCSYDTDTRHKPPGARCQNPECRVFLCQRCAEKKPVSCVVCGQSLCGACMKTSPGINEMVFCRKHFEEFIGENHKKQLRTCIETKQR